MLAVQQWLWVGTPGGFVYGNPRVGKTTGIKYASESISTRSGGSVPFIYYSVQRDQRKTDKKFWSAILLALRKDITHTRTAIALYEQLMGQIDIISRQNMERQVILCIDEAQDLSLQELRWLICLHNDLLHQGTNLLVTQVGTLELKDRQKKLFGPETDHIKGRFFNSEYRFHGVRTRNELQQILLIFDDPTAWLGSQTPSSFYLLESCLQGAKLCDLLPFFWRIWTDKIKPSGYSEWPTFYLIGAIRTFFLDFVHRIPHSEDVESYIYGAVKASGILPE
nr:ATP-binding protein [Wenzhouxiangella limi]